MIKTFADFYRINELLEIVPNDKKDFKAQEVDEYLVESLEKILAFVQIQ